MLWAYHNLIHLEEGLAEGGAHVARGVAGRGDERLGEVRRGEGGHLLAAVAIKDAEEAGAGVDRGVFVVAVDVQNDHVGVLL